MNILLDECLPRQLRRNLPGHDVTTVAAMGWAGMKNGALLRLAESAFDVFITIDRNMEHQQRLHTPNMAIILLAAPDNWLDTLRALVPDVLSALQTIQVGDIVRLGNSRI